MQSLFCEIHGVKLHYVQQQPELQQDDKTETVIFLHGFPECWKSWKEQIAELSSNYRVIAPDLLGYNDSDKPENSDLYQVKNLVQLFAEFIQSVALKRPVYLVAHDWGGAIAWNIAAFYPQLIKKLVIINAAHPSTFTREMFCNPAQRQKSDYIHELVAKDAPQILRENSFGFLRAMLTDVQGQPVLKEDILAEYIAAWSKSGALNAMLEYYRQMPQLAAREPSQQQQDFSIPNIRIKVPTLVLWGEQDKAFVPEVLNGLDEYVEQLTIQRYKQSGHWLHHEYPELVNRQLVAFFD